MEVVESLVRTTLQEIEKVLSVRTVVGEPLVIEGTTLIPLISVGFGFGAGGGEGRGDTKQKGEGTGGGTGGGAWVRPKAIVIIDKSGVRIEPVMSGVSYTMEKVSEMIPKMVDKFLEKRQGQKREG